MTLNLFLTSVVNVVATLAILVFCTGLVFVVGLILIKTILQIYADYKTRKREKCAAKYENARLNMKKRH